MTEPMYNGDVVITDVDIGKRAKAAFYAGFKILQSASIPLELVDSSSAARLEIYQHRESGQIGLLPTFLG
jgi:hypothetical protein